MAYRRIKNLRSKLGTSRKIVKRYGWDKSLKLGYVKFQQGGKWGNKGYAIPTAKGKKKL